jgi:hypothetical protein
MFHLLLEQDNLDEGYRTVDDLCRKLKGINGRRDELPPIASARRESSDTLWVIGC